MNCFNILSRAADAASLSDRKLAVHQTAFDSKHHHRESGHVPDLKHDGTLRVKGGMTMTKLRIVGLTALALMILAPEAMARGAASGGVRGAMVGGMVGGSSGAQTGAKVGAVVGATGAAVDWSQDRRGVDSETQSRTQYQSSTAYQCSAFRLQCRAAGSDDHFATGSVGDPRRRSDYSQGWQAHRGNHFSVRLEAEGRGQFCVRYQRQGECLVGDRHLGRCKG